MTNGGASRLSLELLWCTAMGVNTHLSHKEDLLLFSSLFFGTRASQSCSRWGIYCTIPGTQALKTLVLGALAFRSVTSVGNSVSEVKPTGRSEQG